MSDLTDMIAAQTAELFGGADSPLATAAIISVPDVAGSFAAYLTMGDPPESTTTAQGQQTTTRRCRALGLVEVITTGLGTLLPEVRPLRRNDEVTIAAGAFAGVWTVDGTIPDEAGGLQIDLVLAKRTATGVPGVR